MKIGQLPKRFPILLFIGFLFIEICVFLLHKVVSVEARGSGFNFYLNILLQPWIWLALFLSLIQLFVWTTLVSRDDLSLMYSLSSISYPLTMLAAMFIFGEHLYWLVWAGGGLITIGALIVGSSSLEFLDK